jgi:hypothetical protein
MAEILSEKEPILIREKSRMRVRAGEIDQIKSRAIVAVP